MSIRMMCRPCGRSYKVPHTDRVWNCKQCGDPLSADESPKSGGDATDLALSKDELRKANAELKRWRQSHKALKSYFLFLPGVLIVMLLAGVAMVALMHGTLLVCGLALLAAVGTGFAMRWLFGYVDRHPVPAMMTFAVTSTGLAIAFAVYGAVTQNERATGSFLLPAVGAWAGVLLAKRGEQLLATMPEAYRRKAADDRAQLKGPSVREQRREREKRQGKRESHLAAWILGGSAVLVVLGGGGYWYSIQPDDPAPTLQAFRVSWEDGDIDALAAHANSPNIESGLRKYWKQRDWVADPPDLKGWSQRSEPTDRAKVDYELKNGLVSETRWSWSKGRWRLTSFRGPR